jgi:hypothetical protein
MSNKDFHFVVELEIYLRGNANDAWVPSLFRVGLDFGKRLYGRTNLNTGRIVTRLEVESRTESGVRGENPFRFQSPALTPAIAQHRLPFDI